jgi:tripartite ATP-independent transporter DctM subunit
MHPSKVAGGGYLKVNVLDRVTRVLDKIGAYSRWPNYIGAAAIFFMVALTFADVIMRYLFNSPISNAKEITEVTLVIAVFMSIAYTYYLKSHVSVDVVTGKLGANGRVITDFIIAVIGLAMFIIIIWQSAVLTQQYFINGTVHGRVLLIPAWPFAGIITLGCIVMGFLLLRDILGSLYQALKSDFKVYQWLLMFGVPTLFLFLAAFWIQQDLWKLSLPVVGVIGVLAVLVLLLTGMPVAFALYIPAFLGVAHIRGWETALRSVGRELWGNSSDFIWVTVAFFVLMGYFCLHARFGEDLYVLFHRWIGRLPGGLAMATAASCTGFAAIVGDSVSSIATMTSVAMPEMKKYKYDNRLSTGSIAGGSIIGPIIPPSIPFIIYGILAQVSIGKLFVAGIIPGLLLGIAFIITIYIWCRINPLVGPRGEGATWRERIISLKGIGPVLALFLLVIGGIYGGVFSPAEGGAIGAVGALVFGLIMQRFTWKSFGLSLLDAAKVLSMLLLIVNGAVFFTRFVAWCNLSGAISDVMTGLGLSQSVTILIILAIFFVLGFIIDVLTLTLIGVPIMHPIAVGLGADPIWFATMMVLVLILGSLTPPVGINLFTMKGMAPDIPIGTIYKGALPFVLAAVVIVAIVFVVPATATWLPGILK